MAKTKRKPYSERSDLEKIKSQWKKTNGLLERSEWSGAVVRAATAAELAANHYIREELQNKRGLEKTLVDSMLRWANGIGGKFKNLIGPISKENGTSKKIKALSKQVTEINNVRNSIVHQGQFKMDKTAIRVAKEAREVIHGLVNEHKPEFSLPKVKKLNK
ncbi:MAG: hypothetical protein JAY82_14370 [Candidatus Thiodiazotropha taylori]|nr:hypothetical protein [Candidatus Thiodiazotropha taylori]